MGLFNMFKRILGKEKTATNTGDDTAAAASEVAESEASMDPVYTQPLANGLLPGEILLLNWLEGQDADVSIPEVFASRYGLDPETSTAKLHDEGFIAEAGVRDALTSFTVPELKDILRENELKVSGKKQDLINRLMEHLTEEDVNAYIQHKPLQLTPQGEAALQDYYYIVPAYESAEKHGIYDTADVIRYVNTLDYQPSNREISWAMFQKALVTYQKNQAFRSLRKVYHYMAQQLQQEEDIKEALLYYLDVFILDLSGLKNDDTLENPERVRIVPGVIKPIKDLCDRLELDRESTEDMFAQAWERVAPSLPFHYLDKETCCQCLLAALNQHNDFVHEQIHNAYQALDKATFETTYQLQLPE